MEQTLPPWSTEAREKLASLFPRFDTCLRYHKEDQVVGKCPLKCRGGDDRFVVFANGNYWCRQCKGKGVWRKETPEERNARQQHEGVARQELCRMIANCKDWIGYHDSVGQGAALWKSCGITNEDIDKWGLGYCTQTPTVPYATASLTIPIFHRNQLVDIRHRLIAPQGDDKYRSHFPKLPPAYFNLDGLVGQPRCYIVEGEKKAIVCNHNGLPTASFPGVNLAHQLASIIPQELEPSQELIFLPDPNSEAQLKPTWNELRGKGFNVKVMDLMMKPDDFILEFGIQPVLAGLPYARWY